MVQREARDNDLEVAATVGRLERRGPILVRSLNGRAAAVQIRGGLGYVPVTFGGLRQPSGYALHRSMGGRAQPIDQSVHGNDWYQCDFDPATRTYSLTYTLPLREWGIMPVLLKLAPARAVKVITEG
jgi:hypothetical protein